MYITREDAERNRGICPARNLNEALALAGFGCHSVSIAWGVELTSEQDAFGEWRTEINFGSQYVAPLSRNLVRAMMLLAGATREAVEEKGAQL